MLGGGLEGDIPSEILEAYYESDWFINTGDNDSFEAEEYVNIPENVEDGLSSLKKKWLSSFKVLVEENCSASDDGEQTIDVENNRQLGNMLRELNGAN